MSDSKDISSRSNGSVKVFYQVKDPPQPPPDERLPKDLGLLLHVQWSGGTPYFKVLAQRGLVETMSVDDVLSAWSSNMEGNKLDESSELDFVKFVVDVFCGLEGPSLEEIRSPEFWCTQFRELEAKHLESSSEKLPQWFVDFLRKIIGGVDNPENPMTLYLGTQNWLQETSKRTEGALPRIFLVLALYNLKYMDNDAVENGSAKARVPIDPQPCVCPECF